MADEFHKVFCRMLDKYSLNAPKISGKRSYHRAGRLSVPEIMTIMILFHNSGYRCLKHFYLNEVCVNLRHLFPQVVSYTRRYFWENAPASVSLIPRLCVCARTSASISIRLSKALLPEASARCGGFSVSSCT